MQDAIAVKNLQGGRRAPPPLTALLIILKPSLVRFFAVMLISFLLLRYVSS